MAGVAKNKKINKKKRLLYNKVDGPDDGNRKGNFYFDYRLHHR